MLGRPRRQDVGLEAVNIERKRNNSLVEVSLRGRFNEVKSCTEFAAGIKSANTEISNDKKVKTTRPKTKGFCLTLIGAG